MAPRPSPSSQIWAVDPVTTGSASSADPDLRSPCPRHRCPSLRSPPSQWDRHSMELGFLGQVSFLNPNYPRVGNCDIVFTDFHHQKVCNFEILKLFERSQNFAVIFCKYLKRNWKFTKYFKISQKPWVIPLKFHEMSLVLWNLVNFCKIMQFLIKFYKSLKDFRKILLKWLGKTVKYCLNFVNFHSCT